MGKMRTTKHSGRGRSGSSKGFTSKHNDRNFDVTKANNIDPTLSSQNVTWCIHEGLTFEESELRFYEEHFQKQLDITNANYRANGHAERCKTMEEWKHLRRNAPEECLYQIGKSDGETVTADVLMGAVSEMLHFQDEWSRKHNNPFTLLNMALHVDEPGSPPHVHVRCVWHHQDGDVLKVGQERALEAAGLERPDVESYEGRYNNRRITFDKIMRDKWLDICESRGINVERTPLPTGKKKHKPSYDQEEYIWRKYAGLLDQIETAEKEASFQNALANSESDRADREHQRAEQLRADVAEITGIKTMAQYRKQVTKNDIAIASLSSAVNGVAADARSAGVPERSVRKIIENLIRRLQTLVEAIFTGIFKVRAFEVLNHIEHQNGPKQKRAVDDILSQAYADSEKDGNPVPPERSEIEK